MKITKVLIAAAAALALSACGGGASAEKTGGDKAAATSASPQSAAPAPDAAVNVTPPATSAAPSPAVAPAASPQPGAPAAGDSRRPADSQPSKAPTPVIGSGGNDLFLFTRARAAINSDAELRAANLTLDVKEGVLTLSGKVASAALKSRAEELARGAGFKTVKNQLQIAAGN